MTTVIDSLVVVLGIDTSNFKKGLKEVEGLLKKTSVGTTKTQQEFEHLGKNASQAISRVRDQVLGLTAALIGAVAGKQFIDRINSADTATARLATNVSSSTAEISTWTGVAARAGGTAEGMASTIGNLSGLMQKLKLTGTSDIIPFLGKAHVDPKFLNDTTTWTERLLLVADAFAKMDPATALNLGQQAGIDDRTIAVLRSGRTSIEGLIESQKKLNVVNEIDAKAAKERVAAYEQIDQGMTGIGRKIMTLLTPAILWALDGLTKFLDYAQEHMPVTTSVVAALAAGFAALTAIKLSGLLLGIGAMTGGLGAAGAAATKLLGVLGKLFGWLGVGALADAGLTAIDPHDKMGAWIDKNIPGASWLDNQASKIGLGRSYAEQAAAAGGARTVAKPSGSRAPRGMRNNNPGNLNFVGQAGATKEAGPGGRFAVFGSMDEGIAALAAQLQLYGARGNDTVHGIISKFAPPNENNTNAYIAALAKKMGVPSDAHLDLKNVEVLRGLIGGISSIEVGTGMVSPAMINAGIAYNYPRGGRGPASGGPGNTIAKIADTIHIHTQATDAESMAREVGPKLRNYTLSAQSNNGLE